MKKKPASPLKKNLLTVFATHALLELWTSLRLLSHCCRRRRVHYCGGGGVLNDRKGMHGAPASLQHRRKKNDERPEECVRGRWCPAELSSSLQLVSLRRLSSSARSVFILVLSSFGRRKGIDGRRRPLVR